MKPKILIAFKEYRINNEAIDLFNIYLILLKHLCNKLPLLL